MKKTGIFVCLCSFTLPLAAQNVGIGTNTPQTKLHVNNTATPTVIRVETANPSSEAGLELKTSGGIFDFLELRKWMPASTGTIAGVPLDNLSTITTGVGAGALLIGTKPAYPVYFTAGNQERMRITATGNIGIGTGTPHASAALHIQSANKGLLIPALQLDSVTDITTIPNPALNLLVFNTLDTTYTTSYPELRPVQMRKGLHFWSGTEWKRLGIQADDYWQKNALGELNTTDDGLIALYNRKGYYHSGEVITDGPARLSISTNDSLGGQPLRLFNYRRLNPNTTGISVSVSDSSLNYGIGYSNGFAIKGYALGKRLGGAFLFSDSTEALVATNVNGWGAKITSAHGPGLKISTQEPFFPFSGGENYNTALEVTSNSLPGSPNILVRENNDDFVRMHYTNNNSGGHYWYEAPYSNNTQINEGYSWGTNRFGDVLKLTGDGRVRLFGVNPAGGTLYVGYGKLSVPYTSNYNDPQLVLYDLDSNNFSRVMFKTATARTDNFWTLAASNSETLSAERYYLHNTRKGNIIGVAGNGVVALNREPTYANADDAAFQVKQLGLRDGIRLDAEASSNHWSWYVSGSGNLEMYYNGVLRGTYNSSTGVYTSVSDASLKTGIQSMGNVLPGVMQLRPVTYRMKDEPETVSPTLGFIAQEVETLFPQLVTALPQRNGNSLKTVNYAGMGMLAIKAVQEQQAIIQEQQKQIIQLAKEVAEIKQRLNTKK